MTFDLLGSRTTLEAGLTSCVSCRTWQASSGRETPVPTNPVELPNGFVASPARVRYGEGMKQEPNVQFRLHGIYLVWKDGGAAGPFRSISDARDYLDLLENQQADSA